MVNGGDLNGFRDIMHFMKRIGWGIPRHAEETSRSVYLNVSYYMKHEYICGLGLGSEQFLRYSAFYEVKGVDMPMQTLGTSLLVLLNASYHQNH